MSKKLLLSAYAIVAIAYAATANSPYISEVMEYCPAPGQFINVLPSPADGETPADAATRVLAGKQSGGMISLGAFGGYAVFRFDHPVSNVQGSYDFKINGNAPPSGSSEPGIVSVSIDVNQNGLPDDPWYELAGSNYSLESTLHRYSVTYHRPADDADGEQYIRWTDNIGGEGWMAKNAFRRQPYWPAWEDSSATLTFSGTRLAPNKVDKNGDGSYFVLETLPWGYVDNIPAAQDPGFNLEWAVDADGNPVHLAYADFFKVHTAILQDCGPLGETSTEITGAEDLHPDAAVNTSMASVSPDTPVVISYDRSRITVRTAAATVCSIFSAAGVGVANSIHLQPGDNVLENTSLPSGIYILSTPVSTVKFVIR